MTLIISIILCVFYVPVIKYEYTYESNMLTLNVFENIRVHLESIRLCSTGDSSNDKVPFPCWHVRIVIMLSMLMNMDSS